jgi:hypothetical protein
MGNSLNISKLDIYHLFCCDIYAYLLMQMGSLYKGLACGKIFKVRHFVSSCRYIVKWFY